MKAPEDTTDDTVTDNSATDTEKTESAEAQKPEAEGEEPADLEAQLVREQDRYLRLAAEFENYKKRTARERLELLSAASDSVILSIIEVMDNFERALDTTEVAREEKNGDGEKLFESLHQGAKMIHQQLQNLLESHGVVEIEALNKPFDPTHHEAALLLDSDEHAEDHVVQVLSKGYMKGDRVLRHSKVGVTKPKKNDSARD